MELYGLKTCDTCRKALKSLPDARLVDVRADGVPSDVLHRALETFGDDLVNTRSATWRSISPQDREMTPEALLRAHPAVMKRPLIVAGEQMFLGWAGDVRATLGVG